MFRTWRPCTGVDPLCWCAVKQSTQSLTHSVILVDSDERLRNFSADRVKIEVRVLSFRFREILGLIAVFYIASEYQAYCAER